MRLLYVALTRAKEKLIFSCTVGKMRNQWKEAVYDANERLEDGFARRCTSMKDWLLGALMPHLEAKILREIAERADVLPNLNASFPLWVGWVNHETSPLLIPEIEQGGGETEPIVPVKLPEAVEDRLNYQYPHLD